MKNNRKPNRIPRGKYRRWFHSRTGLFATNNRIMEGWKHLSADQIELDMKVLFGVQYGSDNPMRTAYSNLNEDGSITIHGIQS